MERTWADPASGDGSPLHPATDAGPLLAGRYRLEHRLREQDGAITWQAFDDVLSRSVTAHVLEPGTEQTAAVLAAARASALATDSRFLRVLDAMGGATPFVICESVTGVCLQDLLAHGPLTALESAHVVREIADALAPLHTQGVFHRRLSPQTITITRSGNVKISGFLIDAALNDTLPVPTPSWREQEETDVQALGKLLYACLVARWPIDLDVEQTRQWGLLAAPLTSPAVAGGRRWVPPATLSSRVSAPLDTICTQILTPRPGAEALRTVEEIDRALARVLGNAAADDQLEHRVALLLGSPGTPAGRYTAAAPRNRGPQIPASPVRYAQQAAVAGAEPRASAPHASAPHAPAPHAPADTTAAPTAQAHPPHGRSPAVLTEPAGLAARSPAGRGGRPPGVPGHGHRRVAQQGLHTGSAHTGSAPTGSDSGHREPGNSRAFRLGRWLIPLFVIVMVCISVTGMLHSCSSSPAARPSASERARTTSTAPAGGTAQLATAPKTVTEFDPVADGGEGKEMPAEVPLATDGNPATAWHTQEYWNSAEMGGLKPGTGLLLDFGSVSTVRAVRLTLVGEPTDVRLMVPDDDANPSTTTVKDWRTVAENTAAPQSVTLNPASPLTTRHLLVYITSLPRIADGHFQAGIAEIAINP